MSRSLKILAGPDALADLREHGLAPERVRVVVGASGGPKWLVLSRLDQVIFGLFRAVQRTDPLHLLCSSIGS